MVFNSSRGSSNLVSLITILIALSFIPIAISLYSLHNTRIRLENVVSATVNMAKLTGGFDERVIKNLEVSARKQGMDMDDLSITYYPSRGYVSGKRDMLGMEIVLIEEVNIFNIFDWEISFPVRISAKSRAVSHYYRK